jgi:RNA polymerase sigma-70 factor (ECF subfamily)
METDGELLGRLRAGDESAFVILVDRYQPSMLRLARTMVPSRAVAEEAVQDTWMGVVRGIDQFEGRSSLKTWLFRILTNRARSAGTHEHRHVLAETGGAVDPSRFDAVGQWSEPVERWVADSEDRLEAATWSPVLAAALDELPARQRQIVVLRDVEGLSGNEVCDILGVSAGNQRLLLHRGRSHLRDVLEAAMRRS